MENIQLLIEHLKQSDLSDHDKETLIELLSKKEIDLDSFVKTLLSICKIGKEALKFFDIDIGDF